MNTTKSGFALQLKSELLKHYRGVMPSFNVIARDFTLHSPDLPPVSSETIRKWLRGESMPHISRIQVLIEWLGTGLGDFMLQSNIDCCNKGFKKNCSNERVRLCDMLEKLNEQETQAMVAVLHMLAARHELHRSN
jgi:hypothetical protein